MPLNLYQLHVVMKQMTDKFKSPLYYLGELVFMGTVLVPVWERLIFLIGSTDPLYVPPPCPSPIYCAGHFVPEPRSCCDRGTVCILSQQLPEAFIIWFWQEIAHK